MQSPSVRFVHKSLLVVGKEDTEDMYERLLQYSIEPEEEEELLSLLPIGTKKNKRKFNHLLL